MSYILVLFITTIDITMTFYTLVNNTTHELHNFFYRLRSSEETYRLLEGDYYCPWTSAALEASQVAQSLRDGVGDRGSCWGNGFLYPHSLGGTQGKRCAFIRAEAWLSRSSCEFIKRNNFPPFLKHFPCSVTFYDYQWTFKN